MQEVKQRMGCIMHASNPLHTLDSPRGGRGESSGWDLSSLDVRTWIMRFAHTTAACRTFRMSKLNHTPPDRRVLAAHRWGDVRAWHWPSLVSDGRGRRGPRSRQPIVRMIYVAANNTRRSTWHNMQSSQSRVSRVKLRELAHIQFLDLREGVSM